eukprot:2776703-Pyramimonas_sp.AAC.1
MARIASVQPQLESKQSILVALDFGQAFPSPSHDPHLHAAAAGPSRGAPLAVCLDCRCWSHCGDDQRLVLRTVWDYSGVCSLWQLIRSSYVAGLEVRHRGISWACADDIGGVLFGRHDLRFLARVVRVAEEIANLKLKPPKCMIVPLASAVNPEIVAGWRQCLATIAPE